jgi:hypothetical protein
MLDMDWGCYCKIDDWLLLILYKCVGLWCVMLGEILLDYRPMSITYFKFHLQNIINYAKYYLT